MWWIVGVAAVLIIGGASVSRDDAACQRACANGGGRMAACSYTECRCEYSAQGDGR